MSKNGDKFDEANLMEQIHKLPAKKKEALLPKIGWTMVIGRLVFKVTYHNVGSMRFTAQLVGVKEAAEEGDGEK